MCTLSPVHTSSGQIVAGSVDLPIEDLYPQSEEQVSHFHGGPGNGSQSHILTCVQAILGNYLGECQAIKDAAAAARDAKAGAEDRYANARTQQQAEAAEADIKSSTEALAQVRIGVSRANDIVLVAFHPCTLWSVASAPGPAEMVGSGRS